jgi:hypothetical protein
MLVANTVTNVPLDAPTGRIVVTQAAGTAAEVYATVLTDDGITAVIPSSTELPSVVNQRTLSSLLGAQAVLQPRLYGDHMVVPTISLISAGTPTVLVEW